MGRGDIKTKKGKRTKGSYGKCRPQNPKTETAKKDDKKA